MHIQEEEGPKKTFSPSLEKVSSARPRVQDNGILQKEAEAEGNINTRNSNEPEMDVGPSDEPP